MAVVAQDFPQRCCAEVAGAARRDTVALADVRALPRRPRVPVHVLRARRLVAVLALASVICTLLAGVALVVSAPPAPSAPPAASEPVAVTTVVVADGDTLWDIAAAHVPAHRDLRAYVADVIDLNGIDPSALQPGSLLRLPRR